MTLRPALALAVLATVSLSGCLGVANMGEFKEALGFVPMPLELQPPVARIRASTTLAAAMAPVAFSAQGSGDPQGLPLDLRWDFGDGTGAAGAEVTHRFRSEGFYTVTLVATNAAGLQGTDTLLVGVEENRPPEARLAVLRAGQPVARALAGEALTFEAQARDPEGAPVALRWDFGDGATALTPEAQHAYARGGRYAVTLHVQDAQGLAATATQGLAIDEARTFQGRVALLGPRSEAHALDVGAPEKLTARLGFAPTLGLDQVTLTLRDAQGAEVAQAAWGPSAGTQGRVELVLEATAAQLAGHAPGAWSLVVGLAQGVELEYTLRAEVRY